MPNKVLDVNTTRVITYAGSSIADYPGSEAEVWDSDPATYGGCHSYVDGDGAAESTMTATATWEEELYIHTVRMIASADITHTSGNYARYIKTINCEIRVDGVWTNIYSYSDATSDLVEKDETITTGWDKVTGMRVSVYSFDYGYEGSPQLNAYQYIYGLQASYANRSFSGVV